jgi:hypothetical protein
MLPASLYKDKSFQPKFIAVDLHLAQSILAKNLLTVTLRLAGREDNRRVSVAALLKVFFRFCTSYYSCFSLGVERDRDKTRQSASILRNLYHFVIKTRAV